MAYYALVFLSPIRVMLTMAATAAKPLPTSRHTAVLLSRATKLNSIATNVVPNVCPMSRAIPSIPLAPPERLGGAELMIVLLFGVWNKPNPAPHIISGIMICGIDECGVRPERRYSPIPNNAIPVQPNIPGCIFSTR